MQSKKTFVDLLGEWVEDEILPAPFFPDSHPLAGIVRACEAAMREFEAMAEPGASIRWVGACQFVHDSPPGLMTKCSFEIDGADDRARYAAKVWMESRLEEMLDGLPNLTVEVLCRS